MISTDIRKYLRANPDGATVAEIAEHIKRTPTQAGAIIHSMYDAYIDRWIDSHGKWAAVWVAVEVPDHCPKPAKKVKA